MQTYHYDIGPMSKAGQCAFSNTLTQYLAHTDGSIQPGTMSIILYTVGQFTFRSFRGGSSSVPTGGWETVE